MRRRFDTTIGEIERKAEKSLKKLRESFGDLKKIPNFATV